jgi:hypothetical protein
MNWKRLISDFVSYAAMIFATFLLIEWTRRTSHAPSNDFIENALASIAIALGIAGYQDLDRHGHQKVRRILRNCFIAWFGIDVILAAIILLTKTTALGLIVVFSLYPLLLLIVAPFPLALYLNRNLPKAAAEPASPKAS